MSKRFYNRRSARPSLSDPREVLARWMENHGITDSALLKVLESNGFLVSPGYLTRIKTGTSEIGSIFIKEFYESSGIRLTRRIERG